MPNPYRPVFTQRYDNLASFRPPSGCVYIAGRSVEERSTHVDQWRQGLGDVVFADVRSEDRSSAVITIDERSTHTVRLRSALDISALLHESGSGPIYLDITGLRHHVWAPLLRASIDSSRKVVVVYVEPEDYRPSLRPTENEIYDLSERIEGISPIPGFARLRDPGSNTCFVPLLGFEGTRFAYLAEQLEPPGGKVIPVVGLPGFRPEYPFTAFFGNRGPLQQTRAWKKVRYAESFCPFDLYYLLEEILQEYTDHVLRIAPIGTKPHAVGCFLYAIVNPSRVEVVYDHPIRKASRTSGTGRLFAYHVSSLVG